jgi:hypothetical protein
MTAAWCQQLVFGFSVIRNEPLLLNVWNFVWRCIINMHAMCSSNHIWCILSLILVILELWIQFVKFEMKHFSLQHITSAHFVTELLYIHFILVISSSTIQLHWQREKEKEREWERQEAPISGDTFTYEYYWAGSVLCVVVREDTNQ